MNTWLFKTGDNANQDAPLYQTLNIDSYTRLATHEETVSCCGGNIIPPPATNDKSGCERIFTSMEYSREQFAERESKIQEFFANVQRGNMTAEEFEQFCKDEVNKIIENYTPFNTAEEVKNRLAWAIYKEPEIAIKIQKNIKKEKFEMCRKVNSGEVTKKEYEEIDWSIWARIPDEEYAIYHEQYASIRNITAAEFRKLLEPENKKACLAFEENSNMRVYQIVQYIDIVESITGKDFDSNDWQIDMTQFMEIGERINDTQDDSNLLHGKNRSDIPENRQALLRFLEEKGWLYDQFR